MSCSTRMSPRQESFWIATLLALAALASAGTTDRAGEVSDPLAAEVARLSNFLETNRSSAEIWQDVKKSTEPALARIRAALGEGRRGLALSRLPSVSVNLGASAYLEERTAEQRKDVLLSKESGCAWARF